MDSDETSSKMRERFDVVEEKRKRGASVFRQQVYLNGGCARALFVLPYFVASAKVTEFQ